MTRTPRSDLNYDDPVEYLSPPTYLLPECTQPHHFNRPQRIIVTVVICGGSKLHPVTANGLLSDGGSNV